MRWLGCWACFLTRIRLNLDTALCGKCATEAERFARDEFDSQVKQLTGELCRYGRAGEDQT